MTSPAPDADRQASVTLPVGRYLCRWSQADPDVWGCLKLAFGFLPLLLLLEPVYCLASGLAAFVVSTLVGCCWLPGRTGLVVWWAVLGTVCLVAGIVRDFVTGCIRRMYV